MNKRLLPYVICTVISSGLHAQDVINATGPNGEQKQFKVHGAGLADMDNLHLGVEPFVYELGSGGFLGFALDANWRWKDKLLLKANWMHSYGSSVDSQHSEREEEGKSDRLTLIPYSRVDAGAMMYFGRKEWKKKGKIHLDWEVDVEKREKTVTTLTSDIPCLRRFGFRVGYFGWNQTASPKLTSMKDTSATGENLKLTTLQQGSVYVGLASSVFQHFVVEDPALGDRSRSRVRTMFLDLMFGTNGSQTFDVLEPNATERHEASIGRTVAANGFGARFGWELMTRSMNNAHWGYKIGWELQWRPTPDLTYSDGNHVDVAFIVFRVGIVNFRKV